MKKRILNMILNLILPEGAIILTRAEVEALGEYEKMLKGADDEQI